MQVGTEGGLFFVTEGGKLAKSLLSLKTFRRRFILPEILFKYGGEERTGECLLRQNTHEEEEEVMTRALLQSTLVTEEIQAFMQIKVWPPHGASGKQR